MSPRVAPALLLAALALGALCACGDESADSASSPTPSESLPTLSPPTAPPSSPSDTFKRVRVSGSVSVSGDCVVLTDGNGVTWSLVGPGVDAFTDGQRVVVTGTSTPQESDCGTPLSVTTVETTAN